MEEKLLSKWLQLLFLLLWGTFENNLAHFALFFNILQTVVNVLTEGKIGNTPTILQ